MSDTFSWWCYRGTYTPILLVETHSCTTYIKRNLAIFKNIVTDLSLYTEIPSLGISSKDTLEILKRHMHKVIYCCPICQNKQKMEVIKMSICKGLVE